jgi:predicted ATPase with chaperone activity
MQIEKYLSRISGLLLDRMDTVCQKLLNRLPIAS